MHRRICYEERAEEMAGTQASKSEPAEIVAILEERLATRTAELRATKEALENEIQARIEAQQALAESEEQYRALVEQARDGIVVVQQGKIRFANSYIARLTGHAVEELLDTPFIAYLPPDQVQRAVDLYGQRKGGEATPAIYELTIQHRDGSRVKVEVNAGLTTYEGRPAELVFIRDSTEHTQARQGLEESERLLNLMIDHVPALISYVDRHRRYRFVNQRYEQAHGVSRSELAGKHVQEILGPKGYAAAEQHIATALAGDTVSYEDVFEYPGMGRRWMSVQ